MSPSYLQHNEPRPSGHVWFCKWCPEWGSSCLNLESQTSWKRWMKSGSQNVLRLISRHLPTFREVCRKRDEYWRCQENWDLSCSTAPRLLPRHSWWYTEIQWEETRIGNKDSDLTCIHISTHDCLFPMFHCSWTTRPLISWIVSLHCSVWQKQNTISILWLDSKWNTSMNLA